MDYSELSRVNLTLGQLSDTPGVTAQASIHIGGQDNQLARLTAQNVIGELKDFNIYIVIVSNSHENASELTTQLSHQWNTGVQNLKDGLNSSNFIHNAISQTFTKQEVNDIFLHFYTHGVNSVIRVEPNETKLEEVTANHDMFADQLAGLFEKSQWIKGEAALSASPKEVYTSSNPYLALGQGAKFQAELNISDDCVENLLEMLESLGIPAEARARLSSFILFKALELNLKFHSLNRLPEFVKEILSNVGIELKTALNNAKSFISEEDFDLLNSLRSLTSGTIQAYLSSPHITFAMNLAMEDSLSFLDIN